MRLVGHRKRSAAISAASPPRGGILRLFVGARATVETSVSFAFGQADLREIDGIKTVEQAYDLYGWLLQMTLVGPA